MSGGGDCMQVSYACYKLQTLVYVHTGYSAHDDDMDGCVVDGITAMVAC